MRRVKPDGLRDAHSDTIADLGPEKGTEQMAVQKTDVEKRRSAFTKVVDWMIENSVGDVAGYVSKLREQNANISDDDLAWKILHRKTFKNGLVGAATGVGGLITLPVAVPADLLASWRIQIFMAMSIAHVYGLQPESADLKTDVYLILAGDSAKEALKRAGIEVSKGVTKKAVEKYVTREVMKKIWKVIPQKIITKAGEKSMTSFMKMVPLVGAPVGFVFDYVAARTVGKTAIYYYSGKG
jgi:hypothetical protein